VKRRDFITLLGGAAAWPFVARAQQPQRMRRIGVLMSLAADDSEAQSRLTAFAQGLQEAAGARAATSAQNTAGAEATPIGCANMPQS
jgi:putative tryptophan/tyrosine transport system substrate-binding protein